MSFSSRLAASALRRLLAVRAARAPHLILVAVMLPLALLPASELPRLPGKLDPKDQSYAEQMKLPYLRKPYISNSPEDLGDGLRVGTLEGPGTIRALKALLSDDEAGKYSNLDSILLWKDGSLLIQGGRYNGEQLLSADYVQLTIKQQKEDGYFYHFSNRHKKTASKSIHTISGIGAGGQYMAAFPSLNVVAVATAHNKGEIGRPLQAVLEHLVPLFMK